MAKMTDFNLNTPEKKLAVQMYNGYGTAVWLQPEQWANINPFDLKDLLDTKIIPNGLSEDYPEESIYVAQAIQKKLTEVLGDIKKPEPPPVQEQPAPVIPPPEGTSTPVQEQPAPVIEATVSINDLNFIEHKNAFMAMNELSQDDEDSMYVVYNHENHPNPYTLEQFLVVMKNIPQDELMTSKFALYREVDFREVISEEILKNIDFERGTTNSELAVTIVKVLQGYNISRKPESILKDDDNTSDLS